MSYDVYEISTQDGSPTELYEFAYQSQTYRYINALLDETISSLVYAGGYNISRSSLQDNQDANQAGMEIKVPRTLPLLDIFLMQPPSAVVSVTVKRRHDGDTEYLTIWKGRVLSVKWGGNQATLSCESALTSVKRTGLRRFYQRGCPHRLYGPACGASSTAFRLESTSFAGSENDRQLNVTEASGADENYYAGGFIEYTNSVTGDPEYRYIRTSDDLGNLVLNFPPKGLGGGTLYVYPGCRHTMDDCVFKFNNLSNYGGQPYLPETNPFDGTPIF